MFLKYFSCLILLFTGSPGFAQGRSASLSYQRDTVTWFDKSRNRPVPVAIYRPSKEGEGNRQLVLLSPGYPGKQTDDGFMAAHLAAHGYFVVTVQHNLPSDPAMPSGEDLYRRRLPFWETGVTNLLFVLGKLKTQYAGLDYGHINLVGHSNGGDISMLLAGRYPQMIAKVISLDNRRVPLLRTVQPKVFSIRSRDQPADPGVLPTAAEQSRYHTTIVKVNTDHDDMGGYGNAGQLKEINGLILGFLSNGQFAPVQDTISRVAARAKGTVGVALMDLKTKATLLLNGDKPFPMQSVFKFPLALFILHLVDRGQLKLDQPIHIDRADLSIPYASPLRDKYPEGNADITLAELLSYTVSQSDNNGCDILFRLAGGTQAVNNYFHRIGIKQIAIVATEKEMGRSSQVQYTNWCYPSEMLHLLKKFHEGTLLSKSSNAFLWKLMTETVNAPARIKGLLPGGTVVAHKPGTSGTTKDGFTATTNDAGIVVLPDNRRFAIVLFICNATADQQTREGAMAQITKLIWNSYFK